MADFSLWRAFLIDCRIMICNYMTNNKHGLLQILETTILNSCQTNSTFPKLIQPILISFKPIKLIGLLIILFIPHICFLCCHYPPF